jgi:hypothetical protein
VEGIDSANATVVNGISANTGKSCACNTNVISRCIELFVYLFILYFYFAVSFHNTL